MEDSNIQTTPTVQYDNSLTRQTCGKFYFIDDMGKLQNQGHWCLQFSETNMSLMNVLVNLNGNSGMATAMGAATTSQGELSKSSILQLVNWLNQILQLMSPQREIENTPPSLSPTSTVDYDRSLTRQTCTNLYSKDKHGDLKTAGQWCLQFSEEQPTVLKVSCHLNGDSAMAAAMGMPMTTQGELSKPSTLELKYWLTDILQEMNQQV